MSATTTHPLITKKDAATLQGIRSNVAQVREASLVMTIPTEAGTVEERTEATTAANEQLGAVKKLLRKIEATRKEVKEPYLEAGRIVDKIAKEELASPLEEGKKHLEKILLAEQNKRDEEAAAERARLQEIERARAEIRQKIETFAATARAKIAAAKLAEDPSNPVDGDIELLVSRLSAAPNPAWREQYGDQYDDLIIVREALADEAHRRNLFLQHEAEIAARVEAASPAEAMEIINEVRIAAQSVEKEDQAAREELDKQLAASQTLANIGAYQANSQLDAYQKSVSTRSTWRYEIDNTTLIPRAYLCPDDAKIKEFIKANKEQIAAGKCRIAGIKFIEEKTIVNR